MAIIDRPRDEEDTSNTRRDAYDGDVPFAHRSRTLTWSRGHARTLREAGTVYKGRPRIFAFQSVYEYAADTRKLTR